MRAFLPIGLVLLTTLVAGCGSGDDDSGYVTPVPDPGRANEDMERDVAADAAPTQPIDPNART